MAAIATEPTLPTEQRKDPWRGFAPGMWESRVNVREFIQRNYTPYEGDGQFLQDATQRTRLLQIAEQCPVHRTLTSKIDIRTTLTDG